MFTFPKFRARRHLGKDGMGQIYASNASLNNDSNNPLTCEPQTASPASDILPRKPSTRATTPAKRSIDLHIQLSLKRTSNFGNKNCIKVKMLSICGDLLNLVILYIAKFS